MHADANSCAQPGLLTPPSELVSLHAELHSLYYVMAAPVVLMLGL